MGYILKNTTALINSKLTDVGRQKLSQGLFDIRYFQVGDSEVNYDVTYSPTVGTQIADIQDSWVLAPEWNAQNASGVPQSNKQYVKYPYYVQGTSGSTYGLPIPQPLIESVYNTAAPLGFFTGYTAYTSSAYTVSSNYYVDGATGLTGSSCVQLIPDFCSSTTGTPQVGDFLTIYVDGSLSCGVVQTPGYPMFTYKIQSVYSGLTGVTVCLDRPIVDMADMGCVGNARALIYPSGMTVQYDTLTPSSYWSGNIFSYEQFCAVSSYNVPVWNMNIPWSVSPAGLYGTTNPDFKYFGSVNYLGTKEYLGYQSISGQTFVDSTGATALTQSYYYNSFDEKVFVLPEEQKAIAIVHYTNNAVDNFYGEKFATEPYDITRPGAAGQATAGAASGVGMSQEALDPAFEIFKTEATRGTLEFTLLDMDYNQAYAWAEMPKDLMKIILYPARPTEFKRLKTSWYKNQLNQGKTPAEAGAIEAVLRRRNGCRRGWPAVRLCLR